MYINIIWNILLNGRLYSECLGRGSRFFVSNNCHMIIPVPHSQSQGPSILAVEQGIHVIRYGSCLIIIISMRHESHLLCCFLFLLFLFFSLASPFWNRCSMREKFPQCSAYNRCLLMNKYMSEWVSEWMSKWAFLATGIPLLFVCFLFCFCLLFCQ